MKLNEYSEAGLQEVRERFLQIISEHPQKWWSQQLGVSQGLVSSNWKAGKLPRIETVFKILQMKGISPNWFFFEIEPKYLRDLESPAMGPAIDHNRKTQLKVLEAESELIELRDKVKRLEACIKMQELSSLIPWFSASEELDDDKDTFERHILPLLTLMRMLNDLLFKSFEVVARGHINDKKLAGILKWINSNFESSQRTTEAALSALEKKLP